MNLSEFINLRLRVHTPWKILMSHRGLYSLWQRNHHQTLREESIGGLHFSFTRKMGTNSCQNYTHHVSTDDMIQFTSYFSLIMAQFSLRNCQVNCRPLGLLLATYDKTLEVSCDLILSGVIEYCKYLGKKGQFIDKVKSTVLLWEQRYNVMTVKSV